MSSASHPTWVNNCQIGKADPGIFDRQSCSNFDSENISSSLMVLFLSLFLQQSLTKAKSISR